MSNLFKEFLVCPVCGVAVVTKEELEENPEKFQDSQFCRICGKDIASTYREALATVTREL